MASRLFVAACLLGFVACGGGGGSDKGTVPDVPVTTDPEVEDPGTVPPEDPGSPDDPGVPVDVPSPEDTLTTDPGQPDPGEPDPGQPDPGQPDPGQPDVPTTPPGHTEDDGGAMHKPGKNDQLKNCVS